MTATPIPKTLNNEYRMYEIGRINVKRLTHIHSKAITSDIKCYNKLQDEKYDKILDIDVRKPT